MKEIKTQINGNTSCIYGLEEYQLDIGKMFILPKTIYRFDAVYIRIPMAVF